MVIRPHSWNLDDRFPHRYSPFRCLPLSCADKQTQTPLSGPHWAKTQPDFPSPMTETAGRQSLEDGARPGPGANPARGNRQRTRARPARSGTPRRTISPPSDCAASFTRSCLHPMGAVGHDTACCSITTPARAKARAYSPASGIGRPRSRYTRHSEHVPHARWRTGQSLRADRCAGRSPLPSPPVRAQPHRVRARAYPPPPRARRGATNLPAADLSPARGR